MAVSYPRLVLVAVGCCIFLGLVWGVSTSTASLGPYNYDWDGGSELRTTVGSGETAVTVTQSTSVYQETPAPGTVAILVDPGKDDDLDQARLSRFVSQGGTLVVASSNNATNDLLAALGVTVRIDGTPVKDEQTNYRSPALPRADGVRDHERVRGVDALTLNHGTVLDAGEGTALVNTTALGFLDENRNDRLEANETLGTFPVAAVESAGDGEVLVVADESIVTNAMLDRAGNRRFVENLAADHDRAILDYSQRPLPPLTVAFLRLRSIPLLQFLVGLAGIGAIGLWGRGLPVSLPARLDPRRSRERPATPADPGEGALAAVLAERNPDWDREQVRRVTKAILRQRRQEGDDD